VRLLIKLRCLENCKYEMRYHYQLQGFIYSLLKGSKYHYLHDKQGYKFFCFSNIFPAKNLEKHDVRTLIVSSPDEEFITYIYDVLGSFNKSPIEIGTMKFSIDFMNILYVKLPGTSQYTLITGTPVIVRVPRERYQMYDINPTKNYDYIYWRRQYPVLLFLSQVQNNLVKKFIEFGQFSNNYHSKIEEHQLVTPNLSPSLFQRFKFKKQVSTRITIPAKEMEQVVIGTLWEFGFDTNSNKELIQFALDCGLGERNSLGFGFMNLVK
jgi:CRISPR-associated endoribonuclease Cas6